MLRFKFSMGCKLLDSYNILFILITKAKRVLLGKKQLRYWIPASNLVDFIVSNALLNHPLNHLRHFSLFRVTSPRSCLS